MAITVGAILHSWYWNQNLVLVQFFGFGLARGATIEMYIIKHVKNSINGGTQNGLCLWNNLTKWMISKGSQTRKKGRPLKIPNQTNGKLVIWGTPISGNLCIEQIVTYRIYHNNFWISIKLMVAQKSCQQCSLNHCCQWLLFQAGEDLSDLTSGISKADDALKDFNAFLKSYNLKWLGKLWYQ